MNHLVALDAYVQIPVDVFPTKAKRQFRHSYGSWALVMLVIYLVGLGSGYELGGLPTPEERAAQRQETAMANITAQVNPVEGYTVPADFGHMGPKMAAAGVFNIT